MDIKSKTTISTALPDSGAQLEITIDHDDAIHSFEISEFDAVTTCWLTLKDLNAVSSLISKAKRVNRSGQVRS